MNTIAWNCQGAGAYLTKKHLKELHRYFKPSFVFLSETKNNCSFLQEEFQIPFGYDKLFTVEPEGRSGGLALFYLDSFDVRIISSDNRLIDIEATIEGKKVFISFIYGDPVIEGRGSFWDRLNQISLTRQGPWLMIGDFNELTGNHEKKGGRKRSESSFLPFKRMLDSCGMIDFPYKGNSMSWVGYRRSGKVQCRLDRAVGNEDWFHEFSHTNVEYLKLWGSDHRPVLAKISSKIFNAKRSFKFDKRWLGKSGLKSSVIEGWDSSQNLERGDVFSKISSCRQAISKWKRTSKSNSIKKIEEIKAHLEHNQIDGNGTSDEALKLKWELCAAFREEELYWKQKSRVTWLREGDRNTKFFHATTKQRRARNRITKLKREDGSWAETEDGIKNVATEYFQKLFTSSRPNDFSESLRYVTEKVTPAINQALTKAPSNDEIKHAINEINPEKAPGPDGMTSLFYQKFWDIVAKDIILMVKEFFISGNLDARLNQTNICLIPKTDRPREMTEFRPISLCNVCYKIISKILCRRLKKFLPNLISETQSAFVARRLITDNILIAQEAFHALRTNPICKSKFVAIKTDMSKAYDRVEWTFLEALMLKMGFSEQWVSWIRACISSVSYQVLINGEAKGHISPSRGLRQGDPLSPFLFIILTEAFVAQLRGAEEEGRITGLKIARNCPSISHLLFADDSLFFCKADVQQCAELIKIIHTYGRASGQQLNTSKSSIFFGHKVPPDLRTELKRTLGITKEGGMGMYLGLPEKICGSKKQAFAFIQDRLSKRINSWSAKLLSKGGKEVLIKSVAQALPTYVMSCFLLPQDIIKKLQSAISNFWWSTKQENRGLHWIAWEKLCKSVEKGGLGFRDLKNFNLALLAKQLWRLHRYPSSLLARVLKGRYYWYSNPLDVGKANSPSYGWTSMMAARDLLKSGLRRSIGSGANTVVWRDQWLPSCPPRSPTSRGGFKDPYLLVYHLIDHQRKEWRRDILGQLFTEEDVKLILCIKPSRLMQADNLVWAYTKSGNYSVKSGYALAAQQKEMIGTPQVLEPSTNVLKHRVWSVKTTKKIKHFLWNAIEGSVPVRSRLVDRHCGTDRACPRCETEPETINHLLFECPAASKVWRETDFPFIPGSFPSKAIFTNFDYLLLGAKELKVPEKTLEKFPWILWQLWKARNAKVFDNEDIAAINTFQLAHAETEAWIAAQTLEEACEEDIRINSAPVNDDYPLVFPRCQIDASWGIDSQFMGMGFVCEQAYGNRVYGASSIHQVLSPLHAEFAALVWAMKVSLQMGCASLNFETDCLQLVLIIEEEEDWPSLASELDEFRFIRNSFNFFSLSFIPRCLNVRADCLSKGARARGFIFSHVNSSIPNWAAHGAVLFG